MAGDLRLITMAMKICNDLERVGDHAVNIAQPSSTSSMPPFARLPEIEEMARLASEMLSDALDHFVRGDAQGRSGSLPATTSSTPSRFDVPDPPHAHDGGPAQHRPGDVLFLVSRNLERIADLATNIAEDVVFLVEGGGHRGACARLRNRP
jgi:phosphate transport system protein